MVTITLNFDQEDFDRFNYLVSKNSELAVLYWIGLGITPGEILDALQEEKARRGQERQVKQAPAPEPVDPGEIVHKDSYDRYQHRHFYRCAIRQAGQILKAAADGLEL